MASSPSPQPFATSPPSSSRTSHEALHRLQLGTPYILAGGFVSKCFVQGQPFELADLVLIQGADAQIANQLALDGLRLRPGRCVRIDSLTFLIICSITHKATLLRHYFPRCRT